MSSERLTHLICDVDGVLRSEEKPLPGNAHFFRSVKAADVQAILLSNGSRLRGAEAVRLLSADGFNVAEHDLPFGVSSADATAKWLADHPISDDPSVYLLGDAGIRSALLDLGIPLNDSWSGTKWDGRTPTDVVCGFTKNYEYKDVAGAWNAVRQGARLIGTNDDLEYRGPDGLLLPANGPMLTYLATALRSTRRSDTEPIVIGKPNLGMGESALQLVGADKNSARVAVLGDTIEQDVLLASALRKAGWTVEAWVVLTGVLDENHAKDCSEIDRIFKNLDDVRTQMFD